MKTYTNIVGTMNVWQVIEDLQTIGLLITNATATTVTVAESSGYTISMIDQIMANRGFI